MIWIIINIILLWAGICLIGASHCIRSANDYTPAPEDSLDILLRTLLYGIGVLFFAAFIISEPFRWWLG